MAEIKAPNPLVTTSPGTDTSPQIQLHPLVLLTISDYITRHTLRKQEGPIVGAIIGQQTGHEITMEVAFECKTAVLLDGRIIFDESWFQQRLDQFKDTYKVPPLDLTGWFTIGDPSGPKPVHVPVHHQLQQRFGYDSACLLLFHPNETTTGGKLPLTLYEGVSVGESAVEMDTADMLSNLKFRQLSYSVETGEAEMISVDFIAKGGGNATAIEDATGTKKFEAHADAKGKGKVTVQGNAPTKTQANGTRETHLSAEDDELISSLVSKADAVKMLQARVKLIQAYLSSLPPSYLTDAKVPLAPTSGATAAADGTVSGDGPNHQILRSILALQARLPLLIPPNTAAFTRESLEQRADTALVGLLSGLTGGMYKASEMSRKFQIVENAKSTQRAAERRRDRGGPGAGAGGGGGGGGSGSLGLDFDVAELRTIGFDTQASGRYA